MQLAGSSWKEMASIKQVNVLLLPVFSTDSQPQLCLISGQREILSYLQALVMGRNGQLPSQREQKQESGILIASE